MLPGMNKTKSFATSSSNIEGILPVISLFARSTKESN